jgi:hypothetical protein
MKLLVILWAYGILKVVHPAPNQPLYILYDPECRLAKGRVSLQIVPRRAPDGARLERVGILKQGDASCDVEQLVYPGP